MPPASSLPTKPRLVFRVAFAGNREIEPKYELACSEALTSVFKSIGDRLAAIAPQTFIKRGDEARVADFYHKKRPLLRLITGLAEGADALAAEVLAELGRGAEPPLRFDSELAAVLPSAIEQ